MQRGLCRVPICQRNLEGMSRSIRENDTFAKLSDKGWIETIDENNPSGYQYRLRHYLCDYEDVPVDRDDKPLKFAVPRGAGGPIERCMDGDISWKAALAWISLKLKSNWKASRGHRRTNRSCHASRTLQTYPNLATQLSEPYHRVNTSRHARTADTQIASGDLSSCIPNPSRNLSSPAQRSNRRQLAGKSSKPMVSIGIQTTSNTGATGKAARFKDGNAAAHGNGFRDFINIKKCLKRSSVISSVLLKQSVLLNLQYFHKYIWDAVFVLILPF